MKLFFLFKVCAKFIDRNRFIVGFCSFSHSTEPKSQFIYLYEKDLSPKAKKFAPKPILRTVNFIILRVELASIVDATAWPTLNKA